jgi:hypothetical protein
MEYSICIAGEKPSSVLAVERMSGRKGEKTA